MPAPLEKTLSGSPTKDDIRKLAESDLYAFARLVNPHRVYGDVHKKVFNWWQSEEEGKGVRNSIVLLPRDHQKSHCAAVKAAWMITRDPTKTLLYVSATAELAVKQLRAIKQILESPIYQEFWPEMINPEEGKREKWTETEICVDHPKRAEEGVRDSTIMACGLTKTITGLHCSDIFLDDLVVPQNAYTEEGRTKVENLYSQLASIESTGSTQTVVGTRYHPLDLYGKLMEMRQPVFDEDWVIIDHIPMYSVMEEVVEKDGKFLWPKEYREDGKPFGFDMHELAIKKEKYIDKVQFYAQYYNDPNDPESDRLSYSNFQYYDRERLTQRGGRYFIGSRPLAVYAHIDFAYTVSKKADWTALVVIGMCPEGHIYILDLVRFKTDKISVMYDRIEEAHIKWGFRKLGAEVTAAQSMIVSDLKDRFRKQGLLLSIVEQRPNKGMGSKEERISAILEPRYENNSVWHFKGGHTSALEEELVLARPAHDDLKDALAAAVSIAKPPVAVRGEKVRHIKAHPRFGGRL